jgi:hypothetical protein
MILRLFRDHAPGNFTMEMLPLVLDLVGTFVFALSGALAGVRRGDPIITRDYSFPEPRFSK